VKELGNLAPTNLYTYNQPSVKKILDVAGGTGDISFRILENHNHKSTLNNILDIKAIVFDINQSMLDEGAIRAKNMGLKT
jgi:ubiquinone/menaquinone biosynthesis C-methylase UbiE